MLHLAAEVGGIGANRDNPGRFFFANSPWACTSSNRRESTASRNSSRSERSAPIRNSRPFPFTKSELWNGYPEETNAPYGVAKKALLVMCQAYRQQYGLNAIYLLPVNLYGPRDNFDLHSSHVIPALIRKCVEAKTRRAKTKSPPGAPARPAGNSFTSRIAPRGSSVAGEIRFARPGEPRQRPGNHDQGSDATDRPPQRIQRRIVWDPTKPDGQPRRCLDVSRAKKSIGFTAATSLEDGLKKTIAWFESHCGELTDGITVSASLKLNVRFANYSPRWLAN